MVPAGVTVHCQSRCRFSLVPLTLGKEVSHHLSYPTLLDSKTEDGKRPWPGLALERVLEEEGCFTLIHHPFPPRSLAHSSIPSLVVSVLSTYAWCVFCARLCAESRVKNAEGSAGPRPGGAALQSAVCLKRPRELQR